MPIYGLWFIVFNIRRDLRSLKIILIMQFFRSKGDSDKLAEFYFRNIEIMTELKMRYPDWEDYVRRYLSAEVRAELAERGIPL